MRTMLILVLLCSLAQFAIAQQPTKFLPEGCGTIYKCFAPRACMAHPLATIDTSNVVELDMFNKIYDGCSAIIKLHAYGVHWVHVSMESLDPATKSITLNHRRKNMNAPDETRNEFVCKINDDGKLEFTYGPKRKVTKDFKVIPSPIKCETEVKLKKGTKLLDYINNDIVQITVDASATDPSMSPPLMPKDGCDPSKLELRNHETDSKEVHEKVQYSPEKYYCNHDSIFTMKYRLDGTTGYKDAKLTCNLDVTPPIFSEETEGVLDAFDVKCVADVKYFCESDEVKETGETRLERKRADRNLPKASELKCPAAYPHLHVKGRPVFDQKIECVNYGGNSKLWTVGHQTLTAKGPDVYCSDIIQCQTLYKIPESAVRGGSVDKDYLPFCPSKSILQDTNEANIEPPFVQCDTSTGNYTYTVGTEKKIVQKDTKFVCFHPEVSNVLQNIKDRKTLTFGTIAASVAAALIVVGASVAMWFFARRRIRIRNAKSADMDKKLFDAFATNNDEKEAAKQAIKQATHVNEDVGKHSEFNEMLISVQYDAVCSFSTGRTDGLYDSPPQSDIIDMPAKPTWRKTPRKEDVAKFPKSHTAGKLEPSEMNDVHKRVYDRLTQFTLKKMMMRKKK